ncbi:MAG TPA: FHA domain-containing protein [Polyangiaceae bacterium]|nr:FHA domain-containing protein [Polyangiaceae bacterium]
MAASYLRFTIEYPDGSQRDLSVDSESVTVGSGAHCEIRLVGDDVPVEQLRVEARGGGVFAEARSMTPPAFVHGVPFSQGRLLPNTVVNVGAIRLRVESAEAGDRPLVARAKEKKTHPLILVAAAIGFPLGLYLVFTLRPREATLGAAPPVPALWSQADAEACVQREPAVAEAQAVSYLEQAMARRERSPYAPQDGVESVSLYVRAATCFTQAQNAADAQFARAEAERMRQTSSRQFHVHQVRLERALATKEYDAAEAEARILQAFVGTAGPEYSGWLSDLQRRMKVLLSSKKKKKKAK